MSYWKYRPGDPNSRSLNAATTGSGKAISFKDYQRVHWLIEGSAGVGAGAVVIESSHDPNYAGAWNQLVAPVTVVANAVLGGFADLPPGGFVRARVTTNITGGTVTVYLNGATGRAFAAAAGVILEGLALWLQADAITGLVDNDPVATWNDSSGNNNHATQGTAGARPIYKTNIVNGLPVVRFDGTDDGLLTANSPAGWQSAGDPISFFIVYAAPAGATARRAIQGIDGPHNWLMGPYNGNYAIHNNAFINGPAVTPGAFKINTYIHNGTTASFWLNGSLIGSNANNLVPGRIGLGASGAFPEPMNGDIAEILGYEGDLTTSRTIIENYLRNKYGI